eukprot:13865068-Alexandrium_andersonii.AAC.1
MSREAALRPELRTQGREPLQEEQCFQASRAEASPPVGGRKLTVAELAGVDWQWPEAEWRRGPCRGVDRP